MYTYEDFVKDHPIEIVRKYNAQFEGLPYRDREAVTLHEFIYNAFDWGSTPEGPDFWYDVAYGEYTKTKPTVTPGEASAGGVLPTDPEERKKIPVYSGVVKYFPRALAAVAALSYRGNEQHNPGTPLHWDRAKSGDELDALMRHVIEEDWDAVAWRALANLEKHLEKSANSPT